MRNLSRIISRNKCVSKTSRNILSVLGRGQGGGQNFLSLFHVLDNFKNKIFEKKIGMTKIDRHFLQLYEVICFTLYTREIARNHLLYFLACKCVIYFRMTYLVNSAVSNVKHKIDNIDNAQDTGPCPNVLNFQV